MKMFKSILVVACLLLLSSLAHASLVGAPLSMQLSPDGVFYWGGIGSVCQDQTGKPYPLGSNVYVQWQLSATGGTGKLQAYLTGGNIINYNLMPGLDFDQYTKGIVRDGGYVDLYVTIENYTGTSAPTVVVENCFPAK